MTNRTCQPTTSSSSPATLQPLPAKPAARLRPLRLTRLKPSVCRRLALRALSALLRRASLVATALSGLACAHGASLHSSLGCSEGIDLEAFGQTYPEVRTEESEASVGADLWQTDTDQVTLTVSARRTDLRRTLTRWSSSVTPLAGVNAQGFWSAPLPDKFQDVGLELLWRHRFNPEWMLMIQARPGWRTAGTTALVSNGFGATGSALVLWDLGHSLQFAFGAAGDSLATGSQRLLPVAGLDWGFAPHWHLSLGLPRTGLFWQFSEALDLGLAVEGGWNTYYVRQRDAATYPYGRPLTETKLEHVEGRVGFQANWKLTPAVLLNLSAGVVGYRRFEYPDRHFVLKSDGAHGGYGSLGLTVNF